jgi:pimeloyl-ACP methyl ester carboxylesterase
MEKIAAGAIAGPVAPPWGLIGYSMGGRIALQVAENHPGSIDKLVLLAPDGLKASIWYWVATRTVVGNLLFRWTMRRPGWLFLLLRISHTLRLVNPSIYKFAVHYIDDRTVRKDLYTRWTTMRKFRPHPAGIAAIIRRRQLPVSLVYGRYDRIIRWEQGEQFRRRGIADCCRLTLLDTGHQLLRPEFLPLYLQIILLSSWC